MEVMGVDSVLLQMIGGEKEEERRQKSSPFSRYFLNLDTQHNSQGHDLCVECPCLIPK